MTEENTPWEVILGWSINTQKGDFRGKEAVLAAKGKEKVKLVGISIDHEDMVAGGEALLLDGKEVGTVLSPSYSHRMKKSLVLVHVTSEASKVGATLTVKGEDVNFSAVIEPTPFYDQGKKQTHQ